MNRVRRFETSDFPSLIELAHNMKNESPEFGSYEMSKEKMTALGMRSIETPHEICVFVSENDKGLNGFFIGGCSEIYFGTMKQAYDYAVFVTKESRGGTTFPRLVKAFEDWAKREAADQIVLGISTGIEMEVTKKMYNQLGYIDSGFLVKKKIGE